MQYLGPRLFRAIIIWNPFVLRKNGIIHHWFVTQMSVPILSIMQADLGNFNFTLSIQSCMIEYPWQAALSIIHGWCCSFAQKCTVVSSCMNRSLPTLLACTHGPRIGRNCCIIPQQCISCGGGGTNAETHKPRSVQENVLWCCEVSAEYSDHLQLPNIFLRKIYLFIWFLK